jgi:hypothetical protein
LRLTNFGVPKHFEREAATWLVSRWQSGVFIIPPPLPGPMGLLHVWPSQGTCLGPDTPLRVQHIQVFP